VIAAPRWVFLRGELLAVPIPLERAEVTLGRALDADIRINDSRASRLHARIITETDAATGVTRYRLKDLNSTNGNNPERQKDRAGVVTGRRQIRSG